MGRMSSPQFVSADLFASFTNGIELTPEQRKILNNTFPHPALPTISGMTIDWKYLLNALPEKSKKHFIVLIPKNVLNNQTISCTMADPCR